LREEDDLFRWISRLSLCCIYKRFTGDSEINLNVNFVNVCE